MKSILKDLIESKLDYKVIGIRKEYEDILGHFNDQGILKLDEIDVKEIAIVEKGTKFQKLKRGVYRCLDNLSSNVTTLIYGDNVIFFIWVKPYFAIRIKDKIFREAQEEYFEIFWKITNK